MQSRSSTTSESETPQYAAAYAGLGWTYWEESHWSPDPQHLERAFALAQQALALNDALASAHELLSLVFERRGQSAPAIAEGERVVALDPNNAYSAAHLGEVLNYEGRPEEAIGWLEKAMRLNPRGPETAWYLNELGFAYRLAGRVEEAIASQKQALVHDPNLHFAYTDLYVWHTKMWIWKAAKMAGAACPTLKWQDRKTVGRAVPAIKLARLQHNSRSWCTAHIAVNYVLQWSWQLSPDPQTLEQAFAAQKAIALNDSSLWVHPALGSVYLWKKQHDQALAEGERAIALDPNFGEGYATLAEILNYVGRAEEAIGVAEKVIRLFPSNPWYLLELGHAYCLSGRYEEASATLKKLLSRNSNVLPGHLILAIAFSESGREEEARAAATETLRISPKFSLEVWKQRAPYKDPAVVERQLAALRKAGLK